MNTQHVNTMKGKKLWMMVLKMSRRITYTCNVNSWLDITSPLQAQNPDHGQYSTQLSKSMFLMTVEKLPELLAVQADFAWLVVTDLLLLVESPLGYSMWKTGLSAWMKGA